MSTRLSIAALDAVVVVLHPVALNLRVAVIGADGEDHEVVEVSPRSSSERVENAVGGAHYSQVDVLGGASPVDAQFNGETAFEGDGVSKLENDARERSGGRTPLRAPTRARRQ